MRMQRTVSPYPLRVQREMTAFARGVLDVVDRIPRGKVMSYGDVADFLGAGSARAVGRVMATWGSEVPWHRVLRADGSSAPHIADEQHARLREEGVEIRDGRVVLANHRMASGWIS
jgi:methylated-DNA-protein-cysteine methyltransferase-like protein